MSKNKVLSLSAALAALTATTGVSSVHAAENSHAEMDSVHESVRSSNHVGLMKAPVGSDMMKFKLNKRLDGAVVADHYSHSSHSSHSSHASGY